MFEQVSLEVGGRKLTFETGKMARQAHGAVVARYGDTVVLSTACMDSKAAEKDFLPLTVDYREYTYSAGKIPGGFFKREGRPSEKEILTSRLIDRPLRPLFPEGWSNETQIVSMVLSADSENDPDVIGVTAASAALYISKIPFTTPIAAVRIGMLEGKLVVNPTVAEQKTSTMNIVAAGSDKAIVMVESGALEVSEDAVADAAEFAHAEIRKIVPAIRELHDKVKTQKVTFTAPAFDEALYKQLQQQYGEKLRDASDTAKYPKSESYSRIDAIKNEIYATIPPEEAEKKKLAARAFERLREFIFRDDMLTRKRRPDARAAARSWLRAVHARRNAISLHGNARHQGRHAASGSSLRERYLQALHAALQLPAVLGRRSEIPARSRPSRNRSRRPGRTRSRELDALGCGFPLRGALRFRHSGIQRLFLHGYGVRRLSRSDGRGRSA